MNTADANKYFENKEHYLAMRRAFAEAYNNPDIHLQASHFMLYNVLRGKEPTSGFTERTNLRKIYHQGWVNFGSYNAQRVFEFWLRYRPESLLAPFGDTVSVETAQQAFDDMEKVAVRVEYTDKDFDVWSVEYVQKHLNAFAKELIANQKPLDADLQAALNEMIANGEYA
jgi:hypothetical protein